eukprot:TRINITY_DN110869_c0_g1_i1.p1 TRINITY_DN110869_c0_g1~~TRINITY_DN110869_c0_g1_i1.p1  ORF type:complete len:512 (+),score=93.43 TRINITY_DN110869_c0_g1_i1:303-1838(+)
MSRLAVANSKESMQQPELQQLANMSDPTMPGHCPEEAMLVTSTSQSPSALAPAGVDTVASSGAARQATVSDTCYPPAAAAQAAPQMSMMDGGGNPAATTATCHKQQKPFVARIAAHLRRLSRESRLSVITGKLSSKQRSELEAFMLAEQKLAEVGKKPAAVPSSRGGQSAKKPLTFPSEVPGGSAAACPRKRALLEQVGALAAPAKRARSSACRQDAAALSKDDLAQPESGGVFKLSGGSRVCKYVANVSLHGFRILMKPRKTIEEALEDRRRLAKLSSTFRNALGDFEGRLRLAVDSTFSGCSSSLVFKIATHVLCGRRLHSPTYQRQDLERALAAWQSMHTICKQKLPQGKFQMRARSQHPEEIKTSWSRIREAHQDLWQRSGRAVDRTMRTLGTTDQVANARSERALQLWKSQQLAQHQVQHAGQFSQEQRRSKLKEASETEKASRDRQRAARVEARERDSLRIIDVLLRRWSAATLKVDQAAKRRLCERTSTCRVRSQASARAALHR